MKMSSKLNDFSLPVGRSSSPRKDIEVFFVIQRLDSLVEFVRYLQSKRRIEI